MQMLSVNLYLRCQYEPITIKLIMNGKVVPIAKSRLIAIFICACIIRLRSKHTITKIRSTGVWSFLFNIFEASKGAKYPDFEVHLCKLPNSQVALV